MTSSAVTFNHVSKRFRLGEMHDSLRDLVTAVARRLTGRPQKREKTTFWALRDVDFSVARGEAVGIIGPNGAGKSTVLKLLAGILRADEGSVTVRGRLAALIEVGAGFHGDLTGRENIFLNGTILGMSRREIRTKLDDIVAFAGLERFLDTPVKRYSSGMYARLGFSIASHVQPDVLLVDEVLSVGDAVFRLRCLERMRRLVECGTTLVFVTHDLNQMQTICTRTIVLEGGTTTFEGEPRDAVAQYLGAMSRVYAERPTDVAAERAGDRSVELLDLRILSDGEEVVWVGPRDAVRLEISLRLSRPISQLIVEANLRGAGGDALVSVNSGRSDVSFDAATGEHLVTLTLPELPLAGGQYFWSVRAWDAQRGTTELDTAYRYPMVINDDGRATGSLCIRHAWSFHSSPKSVDAHEVAPPTRTTGRTGGVDREDLSVR